MHTEIYVTAEIHMGEVFKILEEYPIFLITENYIKIISKNKDFDGYVTFSVEDRFIKTMRVGVFSIKNNIYWFWYKKKSTGIKIYAPGIVRKNYHIGNFFELNREIYTKYSKPTYEVHNWNLKSLFKHGAMRIHFYPMLKNWISIKGFNRFVIRGNKLYAEIKSKEKQYIELIESEI